MLSIINLCKYIVNDEIDKSEQNTIADFIKQNNIIISDFITDNNLNKLLFCLMYSNTIDNIVDVSKYILEINQYNKHNIIYDDNNHDIVNIKNKIKQSIYNKNISLINQKNVILSLQTNKYNHDIILLLCIIYNINILIITGNTLIKAYYPEDTFYIYKKTVILTLTYDNYLCKHDLQVLTYNNENNKIINNLFATLTNKIYPIGFNDDKQLIINYNNYNKHNEIESEINENISLKYDLWKHTIDLI